MPLVIDPSVLVAQILEDEDATLATAVLESIVDEGAVEPSIFWYELRNVLVINERRGRLRPEQSAAFLSALADLDFEIEDLPAEGAVLDLARRYELTVYDAAYLELAHRRGVPLVTADKRLIAACTASGVRLWRPPA